MLRMISVAEAMKLPTPEGLLDEDDHLTFPIAELHSHYASSVTPTEAWELLDSEGISRSGLNIPELPQNLRDFKRFMVLSPDAPRNMSEYFHNVYSILDVLTTGPQVAEQLFRNFVARAASWNIDALEIQTNPAKHNGNGRFDIDKIHRGVNLGVESAHGPYPDVKFGLTYLMAREWANVDDPTEATRLRTLNETVILKAIQHSAKNGGRVTAIGIAGPDDKKGRPFPIEEYEDVILDAKKAGLEFKPHSAETEKANNLEHLLDFCEKIDFMPISIGHGIQIAHGTRRFMHRVRELDTALEVCPTSNLGLGNVRGLGELEFIIQTLLENEVRFTLASDWPGNIQYGTLPDQYKLLARAGIATVDELRHMAQVGMESTCAI